MDDVRPVVYHSVEEKREAFMRAVNMRKEWDDSSGLNVPPKTGTNVPPVAE